MSERADRLAERLTEAGIDLLLVTDLVNVRYLTGFTGSNGLAVLGSDTRLFVTDFRYVEQAAAEVDPAFERRASPAELFDVVAEALSGRELRLGFDDRSLTVSQHAALGRQVGDAVTLVAAGGLVERLRAIKSGAEIERIRAAAHLADEALTEVLQAGLAGRSERAVALALEAAMRRRGAQRPSFDSIVAAGPHGALPHASPREVTIAPGELVVIDWGAELDGYCSDCTRTVAVGAVSDHAREIYELVLRAQITGLEAIRAGVSGREADAAARAVIEAAGHGEHFGHGLGHGVGAEVHEAPRLSRRFDDELAAGNVVTVEPGVYLPGELGVRIEDLVVVTATGVEVLNTLGKDLLTVG